MAVGSKGLYEYPGLPKRPEVRNSPQINKGSLLSSSIKGFGSPGQSSGSASTSTARTPCWRRFLRQVLDGSADLVNSL